MVQERSSRTSHPSVRSTKSTKRVFSRLLKPSEQAAIDDELAALEEAIRHSPFALLPAVLTPSRAPSNTLIASTRALFFEGPIHLDFASGWDKGPVIEWYDRHRRKGSTLIEKLQLRKFLQPPYYHECIVVFTQGGHAYRVDRRPDPNAPFDTIMRAGCKPYDAVQAVESRNLRELENASDCVVELHWHDKPTIDLLFVLSICFALRQDQHAKQYTLQRYNCYFLSWTIVMVAVRETATWETRLGDVMSEVFPHNKQKGIFHETRKARVIPSLDFSLDLSLDLVQALALKPAQVRAVVQELEWEQVLDLQLELKQTLARALARAIARAQMRARVLMLEQELRLELELERDRGRELELKRALRLARAQVRVQVWMLEQELKLELELDRDWGRELELKRALQLVRAEPETSEVEPETLEVEPKPKPAWLRKLNLDRVLRLAQELELRSMTLVLEQKVASKRKPLFPAALDAWLLTTLRTVQTRRFDKLYVRCKN
jgi:hypothetical protein